MGAVLSHRIQNKERPVAFASRTLGTCREKLQPTGERGTCHHLWSQEISRLPVWKAFDIFSDHQPLQTLLSESKGVSAMSASRIQRWALTLDAYEYTIKYRPRKDQEPANALSRLPLPDISKTKEATDKRHTFLESASLSSSICVVIKSSRDSLTEINIIF